MAESRAFPGLVRLPGRAERFVEPLSGEIYSRRAAEKFRGTPLPPRAAWTRTTFDHRQQVREGFRRGSFAKPITLRQFIQAEPRIRSAEARVGRHDTLAGWQYLKDDGSTSFFRWPVDVESLFDEARRFLREHRDLDGRQAMLEFAQLMQERFYATPASRTIAALGEIQFQILGSERQAA